MNATEMKVKLDELKDQRERLTIEIEQLEIDYARSACPWPKNTVLLDISDNKKYVVDEYIFYAGDWAVICSRVRKDGQFGRYTETIKAHNAQWYRVEKGVTVTETGITKTTEEKLAAWQDATK